MYCRSLFLASSLAVAVMVVTAGSTLGQPKPSAAADLGKRIGSSTASAGERLAAIEKLKALGENAGPGLAGLIVAIQDKNEKVRIAADDTLAELAPDLRRNVRTLLFEKGGREHAQALIKLGELEANSKPATAVMILRLQQAAVSTLKVSSFPEEILVIDLKSPAMVPVVSKYVNSEGMMTTADSKPEERKAYGLLGRSSAGVAVAVSAAAALSRVAGDDPKVIKAVCEATLVHPNNLIQLAGLAVLWQAEPDAAKSSLPLVRKLKTAGDKPIRDAAGVLLKKFDK